MRLWSGITAQLGLGILALALFTGALVWITVANLTESDFARQHAREASTIARIVSHDLAERMLAGGGERTWADISAEARRYAEITGASRILVLGTSGAIRADSDKAAAGARIDAKADPECPGCDRARTGDFPAVTTLTAPGGSTLLRVVNPIPVAPACSACHATIETARGSISVDFDAAPLRRTSAARRRVTILLGLGASAVLVLLVGFLLRRLVIRPVNSLIASMDRLAAGDLSVRVRVSRKNEIALLARHFNYMAGRLQAAQTESSLLYTLVVETSKKLETTEFAISVSGVIQENLRPRHSAFVLDTADDRWACAASGAGRSPTLSRGDGTLDAALVSNSDQTDWFAHQPAAALIADALRTRELHQYAQAGELSFALPVVSETRLIGTLICIGIPASIPVGLDLLHNLRVHLTLAAINSRHYSGAITDGLTRLHRKQYGLVRLEEAVFSAKRYNAGLLLLMCDIDHFKRINDTYGHVAGDTALKEVARRIKAAVRKADVAVRYGGEEFMLILPQYDGTEPPAAIAEKIRSAVAATPIDLGAGLAPVYVTLSIGATAHTARTENGQALITRADTALYRAKRGGRNRVEVEN